MSGTTLTHLHAVQSRGIDFTMRVVTKGQPYGKDMVLTHDGNDPLVEFYDRRHPFDVDPATDQPLGQFISRYYLSTLMEVGANGRCVLNDGICLEGSVPDWSLDASAMRSCRHALMAGGYIPAPDGKMAGWLTVLEEPPMIGLEPHPAWAPMIDGRDEPPTDLQDWAEIYHLSASLIAAEAEIDDDAEQIRAEVELGNLEDEGSPEYALPVFVTADGAIEFVNFATDAIDPRLEAREIFKRGFGMDWPWTMEGVEP